MESSRRYREQITSKRAELSSYLGLFMSGIATASVYPYQSTIGLDVLNLTGPQYSAIFFLSGSLSVAVSIVIGWYSDRSERRALIVALVSLSSSVGTLAFALTKDLYWFLFCCLVAIPMSSVLMQQCFAYLRANSSMLNAGAAEFRNSLGRTFFACAWVAAPFLLYVLPDWDKNIMVFALSGGACAICSITFFTISLLTEQNGLRVKNPQLESFAGSMRKCFFLFIPLMANGALRSATRLQNILLGLLVVRELDGTLTDVGFTTALAAGLELPLILTWGYVSRSIRREKLLLVGAAFFSAYFLALYFARSISDIFIASVLLAVAVSCILSISIGYMQNLIPENPGLGTSLISIANFIGIAIASLVFVPFSESVSVRGCLLVSAAVVLGGGLVLLLWEKRRN